MSSAEERRAPMPPTASYSDVELLRHSAQILGVPLSALLSLRSSSQLQSHIGIEIDRDRWTDGQFDHKQIVNEMLPLLDVNNTAYTTPDSTSVPAWQLPADREPMVLTERDGGTNGPPSLLEPSSIFSITGQNNTVFSQTQIGHTPPSNLSSSTQVGMESTFLPGHGLATLPPTFEYTSASSQTIWLNASPTAYEHIEVQPAPASKKWPSEFGSNVFSTESGNRGEYSVEAGQLDYPNSGNNPANCVESFSDELSVHPSTSSFGCQDTVSSPSCETPSVQRHSQSQSLSSQYQGNELTNSAVFTELDCSSRQTLQGTKAPLRTGRLSKARKQSLRKPHEHPSTASSQPRQAKRRGPFKNDRHRKETGLTRIFKACVRCRNHRIRVSITSDCSFCTTVKPKQCKPDSSNPSGPCLTCLEITGPTLTNLPCLRYKITDMQLLDKGKHPRYSWTNRWSSMQMIEITDWLSHETKTITLTQDVGSASYNLQVKKFIPREGDFMRRYWKTRGVEHSYLCTPFAIANMKTAAQDINQYVETNVKNYIDSYIDKNDKLLYNTYSKAYELSHTAEKEEERGLLRAVLQLWVACRMESCQESICSDESLGMEPQLWDKEAGNYTKICVPPVLQAQIEIITTAQILLPMKTRVLNGLQKLFLAKEPHSWFTLYLVTFILLHSCALLTKAENVRAKREAPIGSEPRYFDPTLVEEFHVGANVILAHYHYCNKGSHPFTGDWIRSGDVTVAKLHAEQIQFISETKDEVDQRSEHFRHIKDQGMFEDDFYFVSQLYDTEWQPRRTIL